MEWVAYRRGRNGCSSPSTRVLHVKSYQMTGSQCDQMATLFVQFLATHNNKNTKESTNLQNTIDKSCKIAIDFNFLPKLVPLLATANQVSPFQLAWITEVKKGTFPHIHYIS